MADSSSCSGPVLSGTWNCAHLTWPWNLITKHRIVLTVGNCTSNIVETFHSEICRSEQNEYHDPKTNITAVLPKWPEGVLAQRTPRRGQFISTPEKLHETRWVSPQCLRSSMPPLPPSSFFLFHLRAGPPWALVVVAHTAVYSARDWTIDFCVFFYFIHSFIHSFN